MKITNLFSCLIFLCILCFSSTLKSQCNTVAIDGQNIGSSTAGNPIDVCAGATVDVTGTVTGGLLAIQFYQGTILIQTNSFTSLPGTLVVPATGTYQLFSNMGTTTCSTGHLAASGGPSNNLIVGALDIDCLTGPFTGTTTCATDADYPGQCSTNTNAAPGVWYKIQGIDADITLDLCTSTNYDTQMSVWSGSPSSLTCDGGSDDFCGLGSQVTFSSVLGTTYYVYVFGHTNNPNGDFTLTVTCDCTTTVLNINDAGHGSLRDAVACAISGDVITFDPSINTQLIQLTSGQISINKDLTIEGNGVDNTIIDGALDNSSRLLLVNSGSTVHFENITFQNGGSASYADAGAGLYTFGNTSILDCNFSNNNNLNFTGSAIRQDNGDLKVVNCKFENNGITGSGSFESVIWIQNLSSTAYISQCIFSGNDVSTLIVENSSSFDFRNNTVDGNALSTRILQVSSAAINVHNNILNDNIDPIVKFQSGTISATNNISFLSDVTLLPTADGNIVGDALLNANQTLMSTSPAIAAGSNNEISEDILDVDGDGVTMEDLPSDFDGNIRIEGCTSNIDIGAFETDDSGTGVVSNTRDDGYGSLRYEVACAASGSTITFDPSINMQLIQLTSGQITINNDLNIEGNGVANTIIDGVLDDNSRLFRVDAGHTVHFEGMTFQNGGSATFGGRGAALETRGLVSILNCQFSENNNTNAGIAIMQWDGDLKIVNSEFSQNGLLGSGGNECVIWKQGTNSSAQIHQCTFWGNDVVLTEVLSVDGVSFDFSQNSMSNTNNQRLIFLQGVGANTVHNNVLNSTGDLMALAGGATATTSNNLLEHTDAQLPSADGNFVGDPLFTNASTGDLSLMSGSPAISAADDTTLPLDILDVDGDSDVTEVLPLDYNGDARTHGCLLDIGAIEYQGNDMAIVVTNTNDSGPGSFRAALACAPDGSTITFDAATDGTPIMLLTGNLFPTNNNITIKGNGLGNTILDGDLMNDRLFDLDGKTMHVEDLTMQKFYKTGFFSKAMISDLSNGAYIEIQNCLIDESGSGDFPSLIMARGSTFVLENSRVTNCTGEVLIIAQNNSPNNIIKQCLFDNNTVTFFEAFGNKGSGTTTDFIQNTFTNNTCTSTTPDPVIKAESSAGVTISNNIIYNNTGFSQALFLASGSVLNAATSNIVDTPGDLPAGSYIIDNPLFVDLAADNYKLQACSPAIGRGDATQAPTTDTEGDARPTGFGVDIGWDEYTGPACTEGACATPIEINCGEVIEADNYPGANNLSDYSACNGAPLDGPERIYEIETTDVGDIVVTILSSINTDLNIVLADDCGTVLTCVSTSASGSSMSISNAAVGTYYIILDGQNAATGYMEFMVDATCGHVPCSENVVMINAPDDPMGLYHAIDEIQSDATINNDATYKAGNHIDLNEGFEVTAGQVFEAIIEPCPN